MYAMSLDTEKGKNGTLQTLVDDINQSIKVIISTPKNTKIREPDFGCDIWELLDNPSTRIVRVITAVTEAVNKYEKRITVESVTPDFTQLVSGQIFINIAYQIKESGSLGTASIDLVA